MLGRKPYSKHILMAITALVLLVVVAGLLTMMWGAKDGPSPPAPPSPGLLPLGAELVTPVAAATPTGPVPTLATMPVFPTFTPTPTFTPESPYAILGTPANVVSQNDDYAAALAEPGQGFVARYQYHQGAARSGHEGIRPAEGGPTWWTIERTFVEFDTSHVSRQPSEVTLRLRVIGKPAVDIPHAVHVGTWNGPAAEQEPLVLWTSYDPTSLAVFLEGDDQGVDPPSERTVLVPLDPSVVVQAGVTRLAIRSTLEGRPPPSGDLICAACRQFLVYDDINLLVVP